MNNSSFAFPFSHPGNNLWASAAIPVYQLAIYRTPLIVWTVVLLIINIFGAFLNGVTFAATLTFNPLRQSSSCLLLAHCLLIDFFITIFPQPSAVLIVYFGARQFPASFCRGWGTIVYVAFYANYWTHMVLAVNRFIAAVYPHRYRFFTSRPMLTVALLCPWVISLILNIFAIAEIYLRFDLQQKPWTGCVPGPIDSSFQRVINGFGIYMPCAIIGFCYSVVCIKAKVTMRQRVGDHIKPVVLQQRYEMAKMLFMCFLWFCIANYSLPIVAIYYPALYFGNPLAQLAVKGLQFSSSAINPVFFIAVSRNYRTGVAELLRGNVCPSGTNGRRMVTLAKGSQRDPTVLSTNSGTGTGRTPGDPRTSVSK